MRTKRASQKKTPNLAPTRGGRGLGEAPTGGPQPQVGTGPWERGGLKGLLKFFYIKNGTDGARTRNFRRDRAVL